MNLKSCDGCGIVLDADKLNFPTEFWREDGDIDTEMAAWNGCDFVPKVKCPVCGADILEK